MPDHVHLILAPFHLVILAQIMQGIKSSYAHRINKILRRTGRVWQRESFDRFLRSEEHLDLKLEYMRMNPVRAGLVQRPEDYRWLWMSDVILPLAG